MVDENFHAIEFVLLLTNSHEPGGTGVLHLPFYDDFLTAIVLHL
jgi:hypothetical protein